MIGSGNISSYGTRTHGHTVTKCLHGADGTRLKGGGSLAGGGGAPAARAEGQQQEIFSLKGLLSDGWKGFVSKSVHFFGEIWEDGEAVPGDRADGKCAVWTAAEHQAQGTAGDGKQVAGIAAVSSAVSAESVVTVVPAISAAAVGPGDRKVCVAGTGAGNKAGKRTGNMVGGEAGNRAGNKAGDKAGNTGNKAGGAESDAGHIAEGEGQGENFLQRFLGRVARVRRLWAKLDETEKQTGVLADGDPMDFGIGDGSYLLDSYNRSGEYSTLAKDRSLEGKFRAMG